MASPPWRLQLQLNDQGFQAELAQALSRNELWRSLLQPGNWQWGAYPEKALFFPYLSQASIFVVR